MDIQEYLKEIAKSESALETFFLGYISLATQVADLKREIKEINNKIGRTETFIKSDFRYEELSRGILDQMMKSSEEKS